MKYTVLLLLMIFALTCVKSGYVYAQKPGMSMYHLDADNGLPDNTIYEIIVDKYGYLWMCTPKGVVRYNGYNFKIFNLSDGLLSEDVWDLFEDDKDRIWLGSITNGVGYIKHNKYHKCYLDGLSGTLYPRGFRQRKDGISFITLHQASGEHYSVCMENNDTLRKITLNPRQFESSKDTCPGQITMFLLNSGKTFAIYLSRIYELVTPLEDALKHGSLPPKQVSILNGSIDAKHRSTAITGAGSSLIFYMVDANTTRFDRLDLANLTYYAVDLKRMGFPEPIEYIFPSTLEDRIYVISKSRIIVLDTNFAFQRSFLIRNHIADPFTDGTKVRAGIEHSFWPFVLGTTNGGAWVNYDSCSHFRKTNPGFPDYNFVGESESVSYLWNQPQKSFAILKQGKLISGANQPEWFNLKRVIPWAGDTLLLGGRRILLYANGHATEIPARHPLTNIVDFARAGDTVFATASNGLYKIAPRHLCIPIDSDRYKGVSYDAFRKSIWAFNNRKICVYSQGVVRYLTGNAINLLGVSLIKNVVFDSTYGNTFFKGHNNIVMYDQEKKQFKSLFDNVNAEDALFALHKNTIVLAGRFGVLFSSIKGRNNVTKPVVYHNIKDINYRYVHSMHVDDTQVVLQTDKGIFTVSITGADTSSFTPTPHLLLYYKDSVISLNNHDTITINPSDLSFTFDLINPLGNGAVKYLYRFDDDSDWHLLNSDQMVLPNSLTPEKVHSLKLMIHDNVWRSDLITKCILITPYWWQSEFGKKMIATVSVIVLLMLLAIAVLLTRRQVVRSEQKRHLQMELELKAIYSQINPHFIFNSLNSALLLVSKNEMENAYAHISKFSRLLRSYLRSSRTKFIAVKEEADNLADYIELQQVRFKNRFTYDISVDEQLITSSAKIPSLLVQPFVENAINHGLLNTPAPGHLTVAFKAEGDIIRCIIDDNGVGRNAKETSDHGVASSFENLMIKDLVNIFNKYELMNISVRYVDKTTPQNGTTVIIEIKGQTS